MLITGIRQKINSEKDSRISGEFKRYLLYYLQMFAFLGVIFPILICIDYFVEPLEKEELVINKSIYQLTSDYYTYYVYTDSYRFRSNLIFFENVSKGDIVTFQYSPIFSVLTNVMAYESDLVYICELGNVYGWLLVFAGATFILSAMALIKTNNKRKNDKNDSLINIGIINALLCIIIIVSVLFQKLY